ncbi:tyrosyl-trna synthetase [Fusarium flagelliforme]|uniref:Tyrosine--tRNA ligase n=1 Tax=Fusarium flagelliforme TaxID=2675880 RepID=A0A395MW18_9HYPO|nr:tyrosyl-trna synthetase [Fusarium flagelliforme]
MTPEQSLALIKANLAEILNPEIIDDVILNQHRPLKIYWGTATTGKPHCGYFVPMVKIAELLHAGCHVKILIADVHGFLDSLNVPFERIAPRSDYYQFIIKSLLRSIGVSTDRLEFVIGSSFQWSEAYNKDCRIIKRDNRLSTLHKAAAEVVKLDDDPLSGGLDYPVMQALDEEYLDVDAELGGVDQRKTFTFALDNLHKVGYRKRAHLMNALVPGLGQAQKMSSSEPTSKIGLLDTPEEVAKKLKKAMCVPKEVEGNGVIAFIEQVIFRVLTLKEEVRFVVDQRDGDPLIYEDITKLKDDYKQDILTLQMIKPALVKALNELLVPIRADFEKSEEWKQADKLGYPREEKPMKTKKQKQAKPKKEVKAKPVQTQTPPTSASD